VSKELIVIGAGGHAKVVISTARAAGFEVRFAFDDDPQKIGGNLLGVSVAGPIAESASAGLPAVLALGANQLRRDWAGQLDLEWATIVHPHAVVADGAVLAAGVVAFAGAVLQVDAVVHSHAIINTGATVDHDCVIGGYAHIAPGAHLAGEVRVGEGALVGIGATVAPGCSVGAWSVLGAGGVAVTDLPDHTTAVGIPARVLGT
jgi:sugar O-acyltransferase (sialic acid O-acetyltransferase NeuD family)